MSITVPIERYAPTPRDETLLPFQLLYEDKVSTGNVAAINLTFVNSKDFVAAVNTLFGRASGGGIVTISTFLFVVLNDGLSVAASAQLQLIDRVSPGGAQVVNRQVPISQVLVPPGGGVQLQVGFSAADPGNSAELSLGGFTIPRGNWGV